VDSLADDLGVSVPGLIGIGVLVVVQLALAVSSLYDIVCRDQVNGGKKWIWLLVILGMSMIGPILYLAVGRTVPAPVHEPPPPPTAVATTRAERIRAAVDALYEGQSMRSTQRRPRSKSTS
jgi:hypothetical protein